MSTTIQVFLDNNKKKKACPNDKSHLFSTTSIIEIKTYIYSEECEPINTYIYI